MTAFIRTCKRPDTDGIVYRLSIGRRAAENAFDSRHFEEQIKRPSHRHATGTKDSGIHRLGLLLST